MPKKKKAGGGKKKKGGPSKKTVDAYKSKIIEDKTFGMKNKNKSKKVQQYIKQVTAQVKHGGQAHRRGGPQIMDPKHAAAERKRQKAAKAEQDKELMKLFGAALGSSFDPKKMGKKVKKPKAKKAGDVGFKESDAPKLGRRAKARQKRAMEANFAAAAKKKREEEAANDPYAGMTLEEKIEAQRAALPPVAQLTPVTFETFTAWKRKKAAEKRAVAEAARKAEARKTGTRGLNVLSGRSLYDYDDTLFVDDETAFDADAYEVVEEEEGEDGKPAQPKVELATKEWGEGKIKKAAAAKAKAKQKQAAAAAAVAPPQPPAAGSTAVGGAAGGEVAAASAGLAGITLQEDLYLEGDDLDDLDDLDDSSDEDEE